MPRPCLPVDSATSCSTQRPNEDSGSSTTKVSLSRPLRASSPSAIPSHSPELSSLSWQLVAATSAASSTARMSTPISTAGTSPKYDSAE